MSIFDIKMVRLKCIAILQQRGGDKSTMECNIDNFEADYHLEQDPCKEF